MKNRWWKSYWRHRHDPSECPFVATLALVAAVAVLAARGFETWQGAHDALCALPCANRGQVF